jgi:ubiquinone/menaquinone biosynthesis C-methylase UbiE
MPEEYIPEKYWDGVAIQLMHRKEHYLLAGDDDPFYIYKRKKTLKLFSTILFKEKKVLEIGCGPGGNLLEIYKQQPAQLTGCDISGEMLNVCKRNIDKRNIELVKIGDSLPFQSTWFDIIITSTVLQHITDDMVLQELIKNIGRVAGADVYIFERVEKKHKKELSNTGRKISEYQRLFEKYEMLLSDVRFVNIYWSKLFCGIARKLFNSSKRKEGSPQTKASIFFQKIILVFTMPLDNLIPVKRDAAMLHFKKNTIA